MKLCGGCVAFQRRRSRSVSSERRLPTRKMRRGKGWAAGLLACVLLTLLGPSLPGAQHNGSKVVFLVARRQVHDPFFQQSVVLMLPLTNTPLIMGLIVNKPTRMLLGKLFPGDLAVENQTEPAFFGGPVEVGVASAVFRSLTTPKDALRLCRNVYLTFDADLINAFLQKPQPLRLFLGRAQWAPDQLKDEFGRGGWYRIQADGDLLFSSDPNNLWQELHTRAEPSKYARYRVAQPSQTVLAN
jgi:putative AlgH/UPF0301 family transcriptional regulator